MTVLEKLQQKRAATASRIDQLKWDAKRVAEKLANAERLVTTLDEQIAATTESAS